jgi:hypothetical protein
MLPLAPRAWLYPALGLVRRFVLPRLPTRWGLHRATDREIPRNPLPDRSAGRRSTLRAQSAPSPPSVLCTLASRRYRSTVNPSITASSGSCSNPGDRGGCGRGARSAGTGVRALLWRPGPPPNPPRPRATYREAVQSARTRCLINRQRNTARTFASRLEDTGSQAPVFVRGPAPRIPLLGNWQNRASYFQKFFVVP